MLNLITPRISGVSGCKDFVSGFGLLLCPLQPDDAMGQSGRHVVERSGVGGVVQVMDAFVFILVVGVKNKLCMNTPPATFCPI